MNVIQEQLELFPSPSFEEILVAKNISGVSIIHNKRLHKSWSVKTFPDGRKTLTLPGELVAAPAHIKETVIAWALLKKPRFKKERKNYLRQKHVYEKLIWNYLTEHAGLHTERTIKNPEKLHHKTIGLHYDLKELFNQLNAQFFNGSVQSYVRWGKSNSKTSYHSLYRDRHKNPFSLITVAGIYDHPDIPAFVIQGVMYHEMLHIVVPPYRKNGRKVIHGREFKQAERRYPLYAEWIAWEKKYLGKIVASRFRRKKPGMLSGLLMKLHPVRQLLDSRPSSKEKIVNPDRHPPEH